MNPQRVFISDDSETLLEIFTRFVERMDLVPVPLLVTKEVSLSKVISVISKGECGRVITDFNMGPNFTGLDVLNAALNLGLQPKNLVLCTADIDDALAERVASLGCFFLSKPVNFSVMQDVMRSPFSVSEKS